MSERIRGIDEKGRLLWHDNWRDVFIKVQQVGANMAAFAPQWHSLLGECCASCTLGDSHDGVGITTSTDSHTHLLQHQEYAPGLADSSEKALVQRGNLSHCSIQKPRVSSAISFLVSKKTGVLCPIIHLSCLNHHLVIPQFKMETQASVRLSIKESKWTMSIDIGDAYLHISMASPVQKYFQFLVNGSVYQFSSATSPR